MIFMSWHTDCPEGEGIDDENPKYCKPCRPGWYASNKNDSCLPCPYGYTSDVNGATDDSSCTSMYSFHHRGEKWSLNSNYCN